MAETIAPGRVLDGKWTIGEHLGTGGAGSVHSATHRNGTRAAVKILHPRLACDEEQVARFLREGTIANFIGHPGVVAALDDDRTDDGLVYLVLELLEGRSLADRLEADAPLDVVEALDVADAVLDVLVAAHAKGVIHRDIKPANVFQLTDGSIKVLDFGIARAPQPRSAGEDPSEASRGGTRLGLAAPTRMGAIFGSPGFMPPEQAKGATDDIDARTDLWSVAAMLFTMLTGTRLHAAATTNESLARAMFEPCPPIRSVAPALDETVASLVDRGLAFEREDRFPSAERMQGAVRYARERVTASRALGGDATHAGRSPTAASRASTLGPSRGLGTATRASAHAGSPVETRHLRTIGLVAVAALLALFVGTLAWLARDDDRPRGASLLQPPPSPTSVEGTITTALSAVTAAESPTATGVLAAPALGTGATSAFAEEAAGRPAPPAATARPRGVSPRAVLRSSGLPSAPRAAPSPPQPADPLGARR